MDLCDNKFNPTLKSEGLFHLNCLNVNYYPYSPNNSNKILINGDDRWQIQDNNPMINMFDDAAPKLLFDLGVTNTFLDRKSLCLEGTLVNTHNYPLRVNHSFHSLIRSIRVFDGYRVDIENINDYDFYCVLNFDQHLSRSQRKERACTEGFGTDMWGSDSKIVPGIKRDAEKTAYANVLTALKTVSSQVIANLPPDDQFTIIGYNSANKTTSLINAEAFFNAEYPDFDTNIYELLRNPNEPAARAYKSSKTSVKSIECWGKVKNGQLVPTNESASFAELTETNEVKFKIQLYIKSIGSSIEEISNIEGIKKKLDYGYLPLSIFKGIFSFKVRGINLY
jgi:hypothetical protein